MKWVVMVMVLAAFACHQDSKSSEAVGDNKQPPTKATAKPTEAKSGEVGIDAYHRDVDRFCFAEKHAGALDIETAARSLVVADWLGRNLETTKARTFLASIQPLPPDQKAERLRAEAKLAKLDGCPTADAWIAEIERKAAETSDTAP